MSIDQLVENLPEVYQPIFGHPKYDSRASRHCEDRLESITQIYSALRKRMGRDLVVLDLGCAQGYFSLGLAASGAEVVAIDYGPENIDLCKALLKDNAGFKVRFEIGDIINIEALLDELEFDVVIGLSVLHHLTHLHGHESIRQLIASIVKRCGIFVYETALKEEPVYWGPSLPDDPRELFIDIPFANQHSEYATHLSNINRPLFILSDKYWVLGNNAEPFEYFKNQSHALEGNSHAGSRRYYFSDGFVAKVFRLDHPNGEINRKEHAQEIHFAGSPPPGFRAAKCVGYGESRHTAWVILERINGKNLDVMIADDDGYDAEHIIQSVAGQLAVLEKEGLFHSDLRSWNVMLDQNHTAFVIDYGAISRVPRDCVWPDNIHFSFLMFCNEVINKSVGNPSIFRSTPFGPTSFKMPYEKWAHHLWSIQYSKWSFDYLHRTLTEYPFEGKKYANISALPISHWNSSLEQALHTVATAIRQGMPGGHEEIVHSIEESLSQWSEEAATLTTHMAAIDELHIACADANSRAEQAEAVADDANSRAEQAEAVADDANSRAEQAEAVVDDANSRAEQAEHETKEVSAALRERLDALGSVSHHYFLEAEGLSTQLSAIRDSWSWRITAPLRRFVTLTIWLYRLPIRLVALLGSKLSKGIKWAVMQAMMFVLKRRMLRSLIAPKLARFARIDNRLKEFAEVNGLEPRAPALPRAPATCEPVGTQTEDIKPLAMEEAQGFIVGDAERVTLFYVEHTASFDRVTGVQRVCHQLAAALASNNNELIVLIKLDPESLEFEPLNEIELSNFTAFSGFKLSDRLTSLHDKTVFKSVIGSLNSGSRPNWLIVPEVTYHSVHVPSPTSRLIKVARDCGLRVGVIAYDMIPLLTADAASNASKHMNYVLDISLADIIWPISEYAANGLTQYLQFDEQFTAQQMPLISTKSLPDERNAPRTFPEPSTIRRNILCLGTIDERKNQITLIRAFNDFCALNPGTEWRLNLVGLIRDEYRDAVERESSGNPQISFFHSATDEDVSKFFEEAAFTVFPSVEEGYGLPIVESLWHLRPCICANFGSMYELTKNGGCVTVDVTDLRALSSALSELASGGSVYYEKLKEILERPVTTWFEYGRELLDDMDRYQYGEPTEDLIYYWVDATVAASSNTGIQRVNRMLAKSLIQEGHRLVPLVWDEEGNDIALASPEDLQYLERWNGPPVTGWEYKFDSSATSCRGTYLLVDLPLNRSLGYQREVVEYFNSRNIKTAAIFYDAIPYKMAATYPEHFTNAHTEYMDLLGTMDAVYSISEASNLDLLAYLRSTSARNLFLEGRLTSVVLPAEFPSPQALDLTRALDPEVCHILSVGTVEPRKNHIGLLKAFLIAESKSPKKLTLTLVGSAESFDAKLADEVRWLIGQSENVRWDTDCSDEALRNYYDSADFTIFPSTEEGFGLPIVESLWIGRPCICANLGQMAELAKAGGCLTTDVTNAELFGSAIANLANDDNLYQTLVRNIGQRYFRTWSDYAREISSAISTLHVNEKKIMRTDPHSSNFNIPQRPVLSVCVTTYERKSWLELNIQNFIDISSALGAAVELVVCDNASSFAVGDVFSKYQSHDNLYFYENSANIGMLGNLTQTVSLARGDYVWLIGDDDIIHKGALEKILKIISDNRPDLINLNYAYCTDTQVPTKTGLEAYLGNATAICEGTMSQTGKLGDLSANNENFYTAIYSFVVKRSYARRIYSQDTSGEPFSSLQTCVPTTKYILANMVDCSAYWQAEPLITVNLNVSWGQFAPLWILERIPEVYDLAEFHGIAKGSVDKWRRHTLQSALVYLAEVFKAEHSDLYCNFDILLFVMRCRHLKEFEQVFKLFEPIYSEAFHQKHPAAVVEPSALREFCFNVQ